MMCYCGSTMPFSLCCEPVVRGAVKADTCEQLMRSRYSAYCLGDVSFIFNTYHASKRDKNSMLQIKQFADSCHFISLNVLEALQTDGEGYVRFTVCYLQGNLLQQFTERSRFIYEQGWLYFDGQLTDTVPKKIGRNDLCPCGSNKKFKQCLKHRLSGQTVSNTSNPV